MSPKWIENSSISVNNTCYTFNNFEEMFLINLANMIEMKSYNKWQDIKDDIIKVVGKDYVYYLQRYYG